jgi:hypothetical protein
MEDCCLLCEHCIPNPENDNYWRCYPTDGASKMRWYVYSTEDMYKLAHDVLCEDYKRDKKFEDE